MSMDNDEEIELSFPGAYSGRQEPKLGTQDQGADSLDAGEGRLQAKSSAGAEANNTDDHGDGSASLG